jgi:hypothetical protein
MYEIKNNLGILLWHSIMARLPDKSGALDTGVLISP